MVSENGELVEASGTMSGGGQKVKRGGMKGKVCDYTEEQAREFVQKYEHMAGMYLDSFFKICLEILKSFLSKIKGVIIDLWIYYILRCDIVCRIYRHRICIQEAKSKN